MRQISLGEKYIKYSTFSVFEKPFYYMKIYSFVKQLNIDYPEFFKWYKKLFQDNKELQQNREIIICEKGYYIAGIAILKSDKSEKKICTLSVAKPFQQQGIGKKLIESSFEWFQDYKPLITIHKSKQHEFIALLNYYDFVLEQKQQNCYYAFNTELSYNGIITEKPI